MDRVKAIMKIIAEEPMNLRGTESQRSPPQNHGNARMKSGELETIRKIEESIAYMVQHLGKPLRAKTLAAQVNISPSHYFVVFKRHAGNSPIDYFIRLRLQCACHLLENTGMSIKAIACTLGYEDPCYFSRIFKSFKRVPPSRYRHLKLNRAAE
jgi:transcriptional regulator GlxA family with amidase domain